MNKQLVFKLMMKMNYGIKMFIAAQMCYKNV